MKYSRTNRIQENEATRFFQLLQRIKIAFKIIVSPKAIVIIKSDINAFQTSPEEVGVICYKISLDVISHVKQEETITQAINNLVYN